MAERTPARSAALAWTSRARMLAANVVPCAAPAMVLARMNGTTTPARSVEQDRDDGAEEHDHARPLSARRRGAAGERRPDRARRHERRADDSGDERVARAELVGRD